MIKNTISIVILIFLLNLCFFATAAAKPNDSNLDRQIAAIIKTMYLPRSEATFDLIWYDSDRNKKTYKIGDKDSVKIQYYRAEDQGMIWEKPTNATLYPDKIIDTCSLAQHDMLQGYYRVLAGTTSFYDILPTSSGQCCTVVELNNGKQDGVVLCDVYKSVIADGKFIGSKINPKVKEISTGLVDYFNDGRIYPDALLEIEKTFFDDKVKKQLAESELDLEKTKAVVLTEIAPIIERDMPVLLYDGTTEYLLTILGGYSFPSGPLSQYILWEEYPDFKFEAKKLYDFKKEILPVLIQECEATNRAIERYDKEHGNLKTGGL